MAEVLYFSRDTKVFVQIGTAIWEIPIQDGFSFSQATNGTEIVLDEAASAAGVSRRGRKYFNESYAPAEWSFTTYARPFKTLGTGAGAAGTTVGNHHAIEEVLWALAVGPATWTSNTFPGFTRSTTDLTISLDQSNKVTLGTATIYFVLGACAGSNAKVYKISQAVVNEVSMDFDINGIAAITWSGFGSMITDEGSTVPVATIYEDINRQDNFIRNKLTTLVVTGSGTGSFQSTYDITLTGGNITLNNNISYLTPELLCTVNQPIGHVTGARTISGEMTCYLAVDTAGDDFSADLFEDLAEATGVVTNSFGLTFAIGGTGNTPRMEFIIPTAHLEFPTHDITDVVSLNTTFHALPSTISGTDEMTVKYIGAA